MNAQTQVSKNALHRSLERRHNTSTSLTTLWRPALLRAPVRPDPRQPLRSPAILMVELTTTFTTLLCFVSDQAAPASVAPQIALQLRSIMLFANFAEALAKGRGRARTGGLKAGSQGLSANRRCADGSFESIAASSLRKSDMVRVQAGEIIPGGGEVIEGVATVNEAAIAGKSAPAIREPSGGRSAVTGNTQMVPDQLLVWISANLSEPTLDQMIALVEGTKRWKAPSEVALDILLIGLTLIFPLVVVTLKPFALFADSNLLLVFLMALLATLILITIGGLLSAIGITGMDRLVRLNVIARFGRTVEAVGDVHVLLLDKTDTITLGSRHCGAPYVVPRVSGKKLAENALLASLADDTPKGRSTVEYLRIPYPIEESRREGLIPIAFGTKTRLPGVDWNDQVYRKGAVDAALRLVNLPQEKMPEVFSREVDKVTQNGGTPLLVVVNGRLLGAIHLKDVVESGIRECFAELRRLGIRIMMVTDDSLLIVAATTAEAGVNDVIVEAAPEKKPARIRQEQGEGRLMAIYGDGANGAPALAQADVGTVMNDGIQVTREAADPVDLDSDPTRLFDVAQVGKELLVARDALTTFSIANDVAKYFAVLSVLFVDIYPQLDVLSAVRLQSPQSAILSAIVFNALIVVVLIPLTLHGVWMQATDTSQLLQRSLLIYGVGGLVAPFPGIKVIDLLLTTVGLARATALTIEREPGTEEEVCTCSSNSVRHRRRCWC